METDRHGCALFARI